MSYDLPGNLEYLDAYIEAAGIWNEKKSPLFRTLDRKLMLSDRQLHRTDALRMVKRRARAIGFDVQPHLPRNWDHHLPEETAGR